MSKLTAQEIIEKARELYPDTADVAEIAYGFDVEIAGPNHEVNETGGEDKGSNRTMTYYFPEHDVYLKVSGYYQSHYGTDWDSWESGVKEVKPVQKTITVYE